MRNAIGIRTLLPIGTGGVLARVSPRRIYRGRALLLGSTCLALAACCKHNPGQRMDQIVQARVAGEQFSGAVLVARNGQVLLEDGKHTGALPGRVMRNTYYRANA